MYTAFGTIVTAVVTPFAADGSVDHDELRRILRHLESNGSDGVVIAGTTGESPTLSDEEKLECFRTAIDEVGGRLAVIAGTVVAIMPVVGAILGVALIVAPAAAARLLVRDWRWCPPHRSRSAGPLRPP